MTYITKLTRRESPQGSLGCHRVPHAYAMDKAPLLTTQQAAAWLNTDVRALYWLSYSGKGPKRYKVGRSYRYKADELAQWLEQQAILPGAKAS